MPPTRRPHRLARAGARRARRAGGALAAIALLAWLPAGAQVQQAACDAASVALLTAGAAQAPVDTICRDWPYDPAIRLAAAVFAEAGADGADGAPLRLLTAMLDPAAGRVLARHARTLEQDAAFALRPGGLRLDTARYDLAPGVRAFGVVLSNAARGPSCPERGFDRELTLMVRDGDALRPVFSTWLDSWAMVEGSACAWGPQRTVIDRARAVLTVQPPGERAFSDLALTAIVSRETAERGEAVGTRERRVRRVLRYDGDAYATDPFDNLFFWSEKGG